MAAHPSSAERSPLSAQVVPESSLFGLASISWLGVVSDLEVGGSGRERVCSAVLPYPPAIARAGVPAINEKILSMGVARAEMKTVDAQESLGGGVLVLVTGYLTGEDSVKRDFTQSFFLAPQDKGYYVLNDILRFVEEADHQQEHQGLANGTAEPHVLEHDLPPEQEQHAPDQTVSEAVGDEEMNGGEVDNPEDNGEIVEEEDPSCEVIDEVPNTSQSVVVESNVVSAQEEVPKMSYAAIVINELQHSSVFWVSFFPCVCPADGYSIYVKNLPLDATPAQLEEEFKKHGPIKPDGIQVRSNKVVFYSLSFDVSFSSHYHFSLPII
ncbi:hypothetical protein B296_00026572 [Ensete ventricosum]|uniref:NTF2 domain-containing protein n=1 Tax=Ensete ventricosum TaxID=4639 RepID=A0A427A8Q6_ENSVE|nr:hypothetical protein B296_00026572 [Ensete ventricosum]